MRCSVCLRVDGGEGGRDGGEHVGDGGEDAGDGGEGGSDGGEDVDDGGEGWSSECGRSVPSRQIVKPARRRRTRVAEENVQGACPYVHVRVCAE